MSAVGKYFKPESENSQTATCSICNMTVLWGRSSRAGFNTTNLIWQLWTKQALEYSDFIKAQEEKAASLMRQTLDFKKKDKYPGESDKANMVTEKMMDMLVFLNKNLHFTLR